MAIVINAMAMATWIRLMVFTTSGSLPTRRLNWLLRNRYTAARASEYQVSVTFSRSYMANSARKNPAAFTSGSTVSVMEKPLCQRDRVSGVTSGTMAKMAKKSVANNTVTGRSVLS